VDLFQFSSAAFTQAETVWTSLDVQDIESIEKLVEVFQTASQLQTVSLVHH
jgi:hypothetical protein